MDMALRIAAALTLVMAVASCSGTDATTTTTSTTAAGLSVLVSGQAHAGPVCPVMQNPPDPACDDRPVEGAVILILDGSGQQVGQITTAVDGTFSILLAPGDYTLVPQPVEGLLGIPAPLALVVGDTPVDGVDLSYDTGIR